MRAHALEQWYRGHISRPRETKTYLQAVCGELLKHKLAESLYMGCVSYSNRFFGDGKVDKKSLRAPYWAQQSRRVA